MHGGVCGKQRAPNFSKDSLYNTTECVWTQNRSAHNIPKEQKPCSQVDW
jgi:hypothetical protein